MVLKNKLIVLLVGMLLLNLMFAAAAVTFKLEIPNQNNIKSGDTFSIKVLLDVPAGEEIKSAEFILTPNSGATITSAGTASLLPSATLLFGASGTTQPGGGIKYGETTTAGTGVSGNDLLFATLTATADTAGSTAFTFSGLKAKKGVTARTVTSTPVTITIQAAAGPQLCTAADWTFDGVAFGGCSVSCGGGTQTRSAVKTSGNACTGDSGKPADQSQDCNTQACPPQCVPTTCAAQSKNCGSIADGCEGTLDCGTCSGGQTCGADNVCALVAQSKKEAFLTKCPTLVNAADVPTDSWTPAFISKLAQKLKEIFS